VVGDDAVRSCTSIEQLAARYVREIRTSSGVTLQPRWCELRGIVAFEMARQLRAQSETIDTPLLFSPHIRNNPHESQAGRDCRTTHVASTRLDAPRSRLPLETGAAIKSLWHAARPRLKLTIDQIRRERDWRWMFSGRDHSRGANQRAIHDRQPLAHCAIPTDDYDGRATLFRAATDEDPVPLWNGSCARLDVHDTPGGHLEMLDEPTVATVAEIIGATIGRAHSRKPMPHWPARQECSTTM